MRIKKIGYKRRLECITNHEKNNFVRFNTPWSGPCPNIEYNKKELKKLEGYTPCAYDYSAWGQTLILFINDFEETFYSFSTGRI